MSLRKSHAVFLSYASEDTEAARRICAGLRAAGVEVWFDQNELVGGDAWDRKIRRQIKECELFVPVISANTEARAEGYFRLEWLLAVERSRLMAGGRAYLVPVVIDGTAEATAEVPDKFREVQWTQLPGGNPTPAFVSRVQGLLDGSGKSPTPATSTKPRAAAPAPAGKSRGMRWGLAVLVLAGLALAAYLGLRPASHTIPPSADGTTDAVAADAKSIAVLPFVNMSSDPENEYLSDGLTEEILNTLANVPGLRVPARTSSFAFKGKKEDIRKIGALLQVKTVLEGSVRRSGQQLRVTAQLINVADGYHLWSETFDREMTNIFALQDDMARTIAAKLQVTLARRSAAANARSRTANVEAYELVLKGRFHADQRTEASLNQAIAHFKRALEVQPDYALAAAQLSIAYRELARRGYGAQEDIKLLQREATAKALELDDTLAEAHVSRAVLSFWTDWDQATAERAFKRALELAPANSDAHRYYALFLGAIGRHREAVAEATQAVQSDPLSLQARMALGWIHAYAKDYVRALKVGREIIGMAPNYSPGHYMTGIVLFAQGERSAGLASLEKAQQLESNVATRGRLAYSYGVVGRETEARKILAELLAEAKQRHVPAIVIAGAYEALGETESAATWVKQALENREDNLMYLKVNNTFQSNPHLPEWLRQIGLAP